MPRKKLSKVYSHPIMAYCHICQREFDFRYHGTMNLAKKEFCSDECFEENMRQAKEGRPHIVGFDEL